MDTKRNYTIDTWRVIAAIFVVLIHLTSIYNENGYHGLWNYSFYRYLLDIAVPIFFASMGYFLCSPELEDKSIIRKKLSRMAFKRSFRYFKFYIISSVLYVCLEYAIVFIDKIFLHHNSRPVFHSNLTLKTLVDGTIGSIHLWFLMAAVLSFLLFALLFYLGVRPVHMIFIAGALNVLAHVQQIPELVHMDSVIAVQGLFTSMLYIALGMFVRSLNVRYHPLYLWVGIVLLVCYPFASYYNFNSLPFFLLFFSCLFFMLFAKSKGNIGKNSTFVHQFSKYTLFIYLSHLAFLRLMNKGLECYNYVQGFRTPYWEEPWYFPFALFLGIIGPVLLYYPFYVSFSVKKKGQKTFA